MYQIYDTLVSTRWINENTLKREVSALESYQVSEDGKECILRIRPGMRFQDNSLVTLEDVTYSLVEHAEKSNNSPIFRKSGGITVKEINSLSLLLTSKEAQDWGILLSTPLLKKQYEMTHGATNYIPMGSGPYRFKGYDRRRQLLLLERNNVAQTKTRSPQVLEIHFFDTPEAATMALLQNKIDYFMGLPTSDINNVKLMRDTASVNTLDFSPYMILLNTRTYPFSEPQFRRAISLLINREQLTMIPGGPTNTLIPTSAPLFLSEPVNQPRHERQDIPQAFSLFKSLGWNLQNGRLVKNGRPCKLEILLSRQNMEYLPLLRLVAKTLSDSGIKCTIRDVGNFDVFWGVLKKGTFNAVFLELSDTLALKSNARLWTTHGSLNFTRFSNKELDTLFEKMDYTHPPSVEVKERIQTIIIDQAPAIPLFYRKSFGAVRNASGFADSIPPQPFLLYYLARAR